MKHFIDMKCKVTFIFLVVACLFANASVSYALNLSWITYADTANYLLSPIYQVTLGNIPNTVGNSNFGGAPDGSYVRLTSDGTFGGGTGNATLTMAFDFFAQSAFSSLDPDFTGVPLVVYTGHASDGVSVMVTQVDFFSSAMTNNMASISVGLPGADNLHFVTLANQVYGQSRLSTDGNYIPMDGNYSPHAVASLFNSGSNGYTTQSNFSFDDVVRAKLTFSVTGFTDGKYFELDAISTTDAPVPNPYAGPDSTPVPEPSTMLLLGVGLGGLAILRRKANKQSFPIL